MGLPRVHDVLDDDNQACATGTKVPLDRTIITTWPQVAVPTLDDIHTRV